METTSGKLLNITLIRVIAILTIIPLAPFLNRFIPSFYIGSWNTDMFISILLSIVVVWFLFWAFRPFIIPFFIIVCLYMLYNHFTGKYSIGSIVEDYEGLVQQNWNKKDVKVQDLQILIPALMETSDERAMRGMMKKVDAKDSVVRNFSVKYSNQYFGDQLNKHGLAVRYLSLCKYIHEQFKYVSDTYRDEYFATARETILNGLGGDCDDHTILMVSCMKSIGARTRIVITKGHVYPELYCGDKEESLAKMQAAIKECFKNERVADTLYYHKSKDGFWINLDYTAKHPGGKYLNDQAFAIQNVD